MSLLVAILVAYCWVMSWSFALVSLALARWMRLAVRSVSLGCFPMTRFPFAGTTVSVGLLPISAGVSFWRAEESVAERLRSRPADEKLIEDLSLPRQISLLALGPLTHCAVALGCLGWNGAWATTRKVALPFLLDWTDPLGAGVSDVTRLAGVAVESMRELLAVFAILQVLLMLLPWVGSTTFAAGQLIAKKYSPKPQADSVSLFSLFGLLTLGYFALLAGWAIALVTACLR